MRSCFWSYWLDEQLGLIESSGLNRHADVYMTITMPTAWTMDARGIEFQRNMTHEPCTFIDKVHEYLAYKFPWVNVITVRDIALEPNLYEGLTLCAIWEFAKENPGRPILYIHTKGIFSVSPQVKLWRDILNDLHISQWRQRLNNLISYDIVGMADATINVDSPICISGNFFWTHSDYVSYLPEPLYVDPSKHELVRYEYEKWILLNNPKINFVYNTGIDHFKDYPIYS